MPKKRKGERADGLIQISISTGYNAEGKRTRKVFYGHTKAEAERKRDAYLIRRNPSTHYSHDITVAEWVDLFLKTYRTKVNPLHYQTDDVPYNRLKKAVGELVLQNVQEIDLQNALNQIAGKSFSTITKYKQTIQRVFKKAVKNRIIPYDPSDDLQMPSYTRGTHKALTLDEVKLITDNWQAAGSSGLWVLIMLYTGLRRGEMMALDWSAVNMDERTLTVRQVAVIQHNALVIQERAKTQAGLRIIPIPNPLFDALNTVPAIQRTGLVCRNQHGNPLTETSVKRGLEHFCEIMTRIQNCEPLNQSGRRNDKHPPERTSELSFRMHDLRHTYCTLLYAAGVDVKSAAYLMGHSDIRVTMAIYTHLSEERKAESTAGLLSYFDKITKDKKDVGSKLVVNPNKQVENRQEI